MSGVLSILQRVLIGILLVLALAYVADYLLVRYKMARPKAGDAFGTVKMERLLAIPQKDGKTEYEFDVQHPEVTTPCVHSLFPHMGYSPCWYLQRNSQKPIPM